MPSTCSFERRIQINPAVASSLSSSTTKADFLLNCTLLYRQAPTLSNMSLAESHLDMEVYPILAYPSKVLFVSKHPDQAVELFIDHSSSVLSHSHIVYGNLSSQTSGSRGGAQILYSVSVYLSRFREWPDSHVLAAIPGPASFCGYSQLARLNLECPKSA